MAANSAGFAISIWLSLLMLAAHRFLEVLSRELPIDELVDDGVDMVRAFILIIEVVGMLPHINCQQRRLDLAQADRLRFRSS